MSETTYEFVKNGKVYTRKESELTIQEQDHLLGELIKKWNSSPPIVQSRFIQQGLDIQKEKSQEAMNEFWAKIDKEDGNT